MENITIEVLHVAAFGILGVFFGLIILTTFLFGMDYFFKSKQRRQQAALGATEEDSTANVPASLEAVAAIASAIFLDLRSFDAEKNARLTISKVTKPYSPWKHSQNTDIISRGTIMRSRR